MASPGFTVLQKILFIVNEPSLQEGCQIASAGSGLLEFHHDHAETSGAITRVYEMFHPLDKHDAT
jgi:hypothetical protein